MITKISQNDLRLIERMVWFFAYGYFFMDVSSAFQFVIRDPVFAYGIYQKYKGRKKLKKL